MRAMRLDSPGQPMTLVNIPKPEPAAEQVLVKVHVCGVCRTDLHVLDGELPQTRYPVIPGHQIVGTVVSAGSAANEALVGQRVGIPWLGYSCGTCRYCNLHRENLCPEALFTGCQINGGFAEYCVADARYCFSLPPAYADELAAPLLCAGVIGYRALGMTYNAEHIGFMGFGSSAHILTQVATALGKSVYAFTRAGDSAAQDFARQLGAIWAGSSAQQPPQQLDAVIIFAPVGALVPTALALVRPGGTVVCAGIHMSDIPAFPYRLLWEERSICSVANLTRQDGIDFLAHAEQMHIHTEVHTYPLEQANTALEDLRKGAFTGSAVIII